MLLEFQKLPEFLVHVLPVIFPVYEDTSRSAYVLLKGKPPPWQLKRATNKCSEDIILKIRKLSNNLKELYTSLSSANWQNERDIRASAFYNNDGLLFPSNYFPVEFLANGASLVYK